MGNCLSNENSINGRTKARKGKADQRGAKTRLKRSKRRHSLENPTTGYTTTTTTTMDNPVDGLVSSPDMTTATTTTAPTTTTPNPLGSRTAEASSNPPQRQSEESFILGVGLDAQVQVERLQHKRKGGAPMVSCKPPSSTGVAPTSNAQSSHAESEDADELLRNESFSLFSVIALSDTREANVDCPTAQIFLASASTSNGFTPPAILVLITAWLSGLGDNDFFFGVDPSPMPDLEVGGKAAAARPQVLSDRTLALHTKSLALMKSVSSLPGSPAGAKQRHAMAQSEDAGSSTGDFSSLENERLSWLEVSQEDLNTFERIATPSNKSESNKSPSTNGTVWPPGNRKGSLLAAFHARRRTEGASSQPYRAAQ